MEQSEHTVFIKFTILYGHSSWHPKTMAIVTSKITDHRSSQQTVMVKKFKVFQELPKCDTEALNEKMLLEKWC